MFSYANGELATRWQKAPEAAPGLRLCHAKSVLHLGIDHAKRVAAEALVRAAGVFPAKCVAADMPEPDGRIGVDLVARLTDAMGKRKIVSQIPGSAIRVDH